MWVMQLGQGWSAPEEPHQEVLKIPQRNYSNIAQPTSLTAGIDNTATTLPVASTTGYPNPPFIVAIERGDANEEVILVQGKTSNAFTNCVRGYNGTSAVSHLAGKAVEHTTAAIDYTEMSDHIYNPALDHHTQYLTLARHAQIDHNVPTFTAPPTPPVGSIIAFAGTVSPNTQQFLLCYGQPVSRSTYPLLFSQVGTIFGAGDGSTTFNVPDLRGRAIVGLDTMGGSAANILTAANALGHRAGSATHTLTAQEMPIHSHTGATASGGVHTHTGSATSAGSHSHVVDSGGDHTHTTVAVGSHTHTMSATGEHTHAGSYVVANGNHTHQMVTGASGSGGAVSNVLAPTGFQTLIEGYIQTTGSHTHGLSIVSEGYHNHSIFGDGAHSHTVNSGGAHTHNSQTAGSHNHTVSIDQSAAHTHTVTADGGGQAHNNVQPYMALSYLIRAA